MFHHNILQDIKRRRQHESFVYPDYGRYSIAEIPATIEYLFGLAPDRPVLPFASEWNKDFKNIVFLFIDGFGYNHFMDYENTLPFFKRLKSRGQVYPLTSVFPSTTPAALTTLHTGLTPQEHGLPEYTVYFEELNRIILPLRFEPHLGGKREQLAEMGGRPEMIYDGPTLYERLAERGIPSYMIAKREYADSTYSRQTQRGAINIPYDTPEELFGNLVEGLKTASGPSYFFANWDKVDSTEHVHGPRSLEHIESLAELSGYLEREFVDKVPEEVARETLILLSSDHGQTGILNEDIIYLNQFIELEESYRENRDSHLIRPTGAPHNVFLHLHPNKRESIQRYLEVQLEGRAEVLSMDEALARGLYGVGEATERFKQRIGDVLLLPYEGYHIWYKHMPDLEWGQKGIHGGLSQSEMIVPCALAPLSELRSSTL